MSCLNLFSCNWLQRWSAWKFCSQQLAMSEWVQCLLNSFLTQSRVLLSQSDVYFLGTRTFNDIKSVPGYQTSLPQTFHCTKLTLCHRLRNTSGCFYIVWPELPIEFLSCLQQGHQIPLEDMWCGSDSNYSVAVEPRWEFTTKQNDRILYVSEEKLDRLNLLLQD